MGIKPNGLRFSANSRESPCGVILNMPEETLQCMYSRSSRLRKVDFFGIDNLVAIFFGDEVFC